MINRKLEIDSLKNEIDKLQNLLKEKEQQYIDSLDNFNDKFKAWCESSLGKHESYIPHGKYIDNWIDEQDFERYRTINIVNYLEDFIYYSNNPNKLGEYDCYGHDEYEKDLLLAKELMKNNIKSFIFDW